MLIETPKAAKQRDPVKTSESKPRCAWKERTYPVPNHGARGFRWKASALRGLHRWIQGRRRPEPATIMVPALYNRLPAETFALGWLNEIDSLQSIRHRMIATAKKTGWDVFTFHTQHNLDHFYDTTISAVRETWSREGSLNIATVNETKKRFGNIYDYHRVQPRLVENLVFQSSLMEWTARRAEDNPIQFHAIGTALYSALIWSGAVSFDAAVDSAIRVGARWDRAIQAMAEERARKSMRGKTEHEIGWQRFELIQRVVDSSEDISLAVAREDLPKVEAPSRPFWFSARDGEDPTLIETSRDAALALESLNLASWSSDPSQVADHSVRGWMISPLHTMARSCRWSVSNYLLSTPSSVLMFMNHIAALSRKPLMAIEPDVQNRLRLSRMKVTGP
jgi:hypothetical protein